MAIPAASHKLELDLLRERFAVARCDPNAGIPAWAQSSPFISITRTPEELSVVCHEAVVPGSLAAKRGLRCLGVRGPLSFSQVGILESLARPLADASISILAISTYDTDYLLVAGANLDRAIQALIEAGHSVYEAVQSKPLKQAAKQRPPIDPR